jgi:aspartyl-tRNA(Asn)/glutamyl-tRNA(Gln) amidotransferase subunit B
MGHPGTLPSLNTAAVALGIRAGLALGGMVHPVSIFARKHYFYPDLPKGYQISQSERPLVTGGRLHTDLGNFGITRMHLEEDSGKMLHSGHLTGMDWNRAGVPLLEIVSEPDLRTPEQAEAYFRELHRVLVEGGICEGDLEKGQLRCDVNLSLHRPGEPWGTRVELKNLNSFRFVSRALRYEIDRQLRILKAGDLIFPETRTWNGSQTLLLRTKESAAEYRYFPEPDLGPLRIFPEELRRAREALPGIPLDLFLKAEEQRKLQSWQEEYGLSSYEIGVIQGEPEATAFFQDAVAAGGAPKAVANLVMRDLMRYWKEEGIGKIDPLQIVKLLSLLEAETLHREGAMMVLEKLRMEGGEPREWVEKLGLQNTLEETTLKEIATRLLEAHPTEYQRYKAGNKGMAGFFVGALMKATERKADPRKVATLVRDLLER